MDRHYSSLMSARLFSKPDWERVAVQAGFRPCQMAALCQISVRQLERLFARTFHQTPKTWLRDFRCRLAMRLIAQGHSNKEVVAELRFGSSSHFCHDFRKAHAESPRKTAGRLFRCGNVANGQQMSVLSNASLLPAKRFRVGIEI